MQRIGYMRVHGESDGGTALPIHLLYPTISNEENLKFGPYEISAAPNGKLTGQHLPLIAVSHGSGSTPWVHRDLARSLALRGFIVALPEHLGNSRADDSLAGTEELLVRRPDQLCAAIDEVMAHPVVAPHLKTKSVGLIGTSIGAYTALALAGGRPWSGAHESPTGSARQLDTRKNRAAETSAAFTIV